MAFKVNFNQLQEQATEINRQLINLEVEKVTASTAGLAAVTAAGGAGTEVGKAIEDAIKMDTDSEFKQAMSIVQEMTLAMSQVSKAYSEENAELLSKIKSIAARQAEGTLITNNGSQQ